MKSLAHLIIDEDIRIEQTLKDHCMKTANYAVQSISTAESVNLYHTVYLAGLLHDMGKAKEEFHQYLENAANGKNVVRGSVNHTFAGVQWILQKFHTESASPWEKMTSEIIAFAIGAHHGLFDCVDLDGNNGFLYRLNKDKKELCYEEAVQNYFDQVIDEKEVINHFNEAVKEVEQFFQTCKSTCKNQKNPKSYVFFQLGMLIRLILSGVIYGDRRDTSEFMHQKMLQTDQKITWKDRRKFFEEKQSQLSSSSKINQVRHEISEQCVKAAEKAPGIYRMNVPTGGGKTLSALRYALAHAEIYHKKRIIFIIPLLSVLDQNVNVIRDYMLDRESVLEHHSNVIREQNTGDDLDQFEFLTENWNAPVVVSTLVQLLNILFSHQTSAIGRLQALCDSVIVIDEVQTLPKKITAMFNMALNFLQQFCHATIILSSATQPCFEELKWPLHLADEPDLVHLSNSQLDVFRRSKIEDKHDPYGMDWDTCTDFCSGLMEKHSSLLVICNTKAEAKTLFERMQEQADWGGWDLYHLSTAMCQQHRLTVLKEIQEKLTDLQINVQKGRDIRKLICISTQVVEAGVDFSFEGVVRVMAGIDNLAQAAGRCNRSNEYGKQGTVYLINLKNEKLSMLQEIQNAQKSTRKVLEDWEQENTDTIIENAAAQKFYQYFYQEMEKEIEYPVKISGELFYLTKLLANQNANANTQKNKPYFFHQPFKTIGEQFKVFDDNTVDVIVPYEDGAYLSEKLRSLAASEFHLAEMKTIIQQARHYTISIYAWQKKRLDDAGLLTSIMDGRIYILDKKAYDTVNLGLLLLEEQPVENYIC